VAAAPGSPVVFGPVILIEAEAVGSGRLASSYMARTLVRCRLHAVAPGCGKRRRRYVVCHDPQEAERLCRHREQVVAELGAEIAAITTQTGHTHGKRVCELSASGRYGYFPRFTKTGQPRTYVSDP